MINFIKRFLKLIVKRNIQNHKVQIIQNENNISFKVTDFKNVGSNYLVLKDRSSGRRIKKKIHGSKVNFSYTEIFNISEKAILDMYVVCRVYNKYIKKRTPFSNDNLRMNIFDKESNIKLRPFKTKNNYLSIIVEKSYFTQKVYTLKAIGHNLYIEGTLDSQITPKDVNKVEVIITRRDKKKSYGFEIQSFAVNKQRYEFKGLLTMDKIRNDLAVNSRWDLILQVRDLNNSVIFKELINMSEFSNFENEEDRYLLVNKDTYEDMQFVFYATMGKESLAMWYTDKHQFEKTYNIAKGKTIFNQVCESNPINKKMIFFESFLGKSYSGNPKYIYEKLLELGYSNQFIFIWSYSGKSIIPGNPIIVERESEEYFKYLAESKYWVNNIIFPVHRKREGNIYLQTWHGTPLKKLGFDIEVDGPEKLARENFYLESRNWDYLISANRYSSNIFKRAFKFNKRVLELGYPANDIFFKKDISGLRDELKEKVGIPKDKKVILYAPTWRDNESSASWQHSFEIKINLNDFMERLSDEYILLLRMHHLISDSIVIPDEYKDHIFNVSSYDDIQELYVISDILITDYSSVFFEFANTKKPILFFAYDYNLYKEEIRGFYLDMKKDLPGPILQSSEELLNSIKNIKQVELEYKSSYDKFIKKYCEIEDGNSARKIIEEVF
ncbi:CDP-glycerol glycerophosphotransferase family protein [Bacillus inaquosorum]|uniref:CDP-glycerol glycerophosphotransferase family protein n=1 Tax=Bacillus inaquosorum TaxID=483913 RepID=UPI0022830C8E|nr:CDP-glycerol glycerophosphotransferase family protein [Bacillus inaquosorum]MCY9012933.1 CDP-glycerol glycerophosphotransferase family protein [Bacillus inaquosorum]MCY9040436.1 CDP-glycerol glycerophosphotransferase family protein [Bacillus inaquosorum]MCY9095436.1 CDP-glycerol glycerophosphotransferase family protein [Bacillus inaquosorum]MCY9104270.1 CDP-glycerol glycerophosphotransferase family protein [Bacillus inaquosorum]MCY9124241.1 CDP-glycerol glycerophosphotransferase family prot